MATDTKALRQEALALAQKAQTAAEEGNIEESARMIADANENQTKAAAIEKAVEESKALMGELNEPLNRVPVASADVAIYNPDDTTRKTKADYKPATWDHTLPDYAQAMWVQDQCGDNVKEEIKFKVDTYIKWMRHYSDEDFFRNCTALEAKAMNEGTDAQGGFFVPEAFLSSVIHNVGAPGGVLAPLCTTVTVSTDKGYIPTLASATWAALAEAAAFSDQTPATGQVAYEIEKSGGMVRTTRELLDDSAVNLPGMLAQLFTEASGRFQDDGIVSGNNTTQYDGILGSSVADVLMAATNALTYADLSGIWHTVPSQFRGNATWVMPSAISSIVAAINSTGNGLKAAPSISEAPARNILGSPVVNTDSGSSGFATTLAANNEIAILGDFSNYYVFRRAGMTLRRNEFDSMSIDSVNFYATMRGDGQVGIADAFRILKCAAS